MNWMSCIIHARIPNLVTITVVEMRLRGAHMKMLLCVMFIANVIQTVRHTETAALTTGIIAKIKTPIYSLSIMLLRRVHLLEPLPINSKKMVVFPGFLNFIYIISTQKVMILIHLRSIQAALRHPRRQDGHSMLLINALTTF